MRAQRVAVRRAVSYLVGAVAGYGVLLVLAASFAVAARISSVLFGDFLTMVAPRDFEFPVLWQYPVFIAAIVLVVVPVLAVARWSARWELRGAGWLLTRDVPAAAPVARPGMVGWLRGLVVDGRTWRAVGWIGGKATAGLALLTFALMPFLLAFDAYRTAGLHYPWNDNHPGEVFLAGEKWFTQIGFSGASYSVNLVLFVAAELVVAAAWLFWCTPALARLHARLTWWVLFSPVTQLQRRVGELAETRADAVDAHTAELRRIERDLHDGMQAQLVNVTMRLGMAERRLADDPAVVGTLIEEARSGAEDAMTGLRDVLRTMYPPILGDRGLRGALLGLAGGCATATTAEVGELDDLPAPVEAAAYFVASEALTNVAKHSAASQADVTVRRELRSLLVEVTDNGLGGADEDGGTGIVGMRRRVAALDGWLEVTSPVGGPTVVVAELPCGS
ncbi:MAG: histidine kinase [Streptosporangiales bacterium]